MTDGDDAEVRREMELRVAAWRDRREERRKSEERDRRRRQKAASFAAKREEAIAEARRLEARARILRRLAGRWRKAEDSNL